jgi:hypothetical protein
VCLPQSLRHRVVFLAGLYSSCVRWTSLALTNSSPFASSSSRFLGSTQHPYPVLNLADKCASARVPVASLLLSLLHQATFLAGLYSSCIRRTSAPLTNAPPFSSCPTYAGCVRRRTSRSASFPFDTRRNVPCVLFLCGNHGSPSLQCCVVRFQSTLGSFPRLVLACD